MRVFYSYDQKLITQRIGEETCEGLFPISGGNGKGWSFVVYEDIKKGQDVVNFLLHSKVNIFLRFALLNSKIGLVDTLNDRSFKINNPWLGFHNDIQNLFVIMRNNLYPEHVLNKLINSYITKVVEGGGAQPVDVLEQQESPTFYS